MKDSMENQLLAQLQRMNDSLVSINQSSKSSYLEDKKNDEHLSLLTRIEKSKEAREKIAVEERRRKEAEDSAREKRFFGDKSPTVSSKFQSSPVNLPDTSKFVLGSIASTIGKLLDGQSLVPTGSILIRKIQEFFSIVLKSVNPFRVAEGVTSSLSKIFEKFSNSFMGRILAPLNKLLKLIPSFISKGLFSVGEKLFSILLKGFDFFALPALIWGFVRNYIRGALSSTRFGNAIFSLVDNILQPINNYFDKLANVIKDVFTGNFRDIYTQLNGMSHDILDFTYGLLINPLKQMFDALPESVRKNSKALEVIKWFDSLFSSISEELLSVLSDSVELLKYSFSSLKKAISQLFSGKFSLSGEFFADALSSLMKIPYMIGYKIGEWISSILPKITESFKDIKFTDILNNVGKGIITLLQDIGKFVIGFVSELAENLINSLPYLPKGAKSKVMSSINSFKNYVSAPSQPASSTPSSNQTKQSQVLSNFSTSTPSNNLSSEKPKETSLDQPQIIGDAAPTSSTDINNPAVSVQIDGMKRIYTMKDGTKQIREGGTLAWRNNNPGNIRWIGNGAPVVKYGALAKDNQQFAIFPTIEAGESAQRDLLFGPKSRYRNRTLSETIAIYAPKNDNNPTEVYQANALKAVGGEDKPLSSYSPEQQSQILSAITKQEGGFSSGRVSISSNTGQRIATPAEVRGTVANYGKLQPTPLTSSVAPVTPSPDGYTEKTVQQVVAENQQGMDTSRMSLLDITKQAIVNADSLKRMVHRKAYDITKGNNLTVSSGITPPSSSVAVKDQEEVSKQQLEVSKSIAQTSQAANWDLDTAPFDVDLVKLNLGEI